MVFVGTLVVNRKGKKSRKNVADTLGSVKYFFLVYLQKQFRSYSAKHPTVNGKIRHAPFVCVLRF